MTSRTGLMPAVTRSASSGRDRDNRQPTVKKVSSATLARRARSPSPAQVGRGSVKTVRRDDSIGKQRREVPHKGFQRNSLLGKQPRHSETTRVKASVAIPTAMMGIRNHENITRTHQPASTPPREVHYDDQDGEQSDKDAFDIDNISANTSEVRDLIKMYKVLLGGGETDSKKAPTADDSETDIQPAALTPEAIGSMSLRQLESEKVEEVTITNNISEDVGGDPSVLELPRAQTIEDIFDGDQFATGHKKQSTPQRKKPTQTTTPKVYTDYHRQMERVEKELKESAAERAILTAQNASLESKCLGLESELEAMRKQHVELHLSTQNTNEKLITSIQGILTSMNDLSERVRTIESNQQQTAATTINPPTSHSAPKPVVTGKGIEETITNRACLSHAADIVDPSSEDEAPVASGVPPLPRSVPSLQAQVLESGKGTRLEETIASYHKLDHSTSIPKSKKITVVNEPASLNLDSFDHRATARCLNLGGDVQPVSLTPASNGNAALSPGASPDESVGSGSTSPSPYSVRNEMIRKLHESYGTATTAIHVSH